jgi:CBS domain containing-hemolysin-like protein|uniref:HlyC/CorC family transporter n=1 Tax=Desulfobacca acetoxidans TaxID=60893 RepID=A0A7V6A5G9_9BACT
MDEGDSPRPSFLKRLWQRLFSRRAITHPGDLEREIGSILEICEEKDFISSQERELIESIIEFKDTLVREIMVPRTEIIAVERDTPLEEIFRTVAESGHSRFPVYEDTIDNIVGLLLAKDLLNFCQVPEVRLDLKQVLRPVYFIPESKRISDLLRDLVERKAQIAVVIDEYGGTAGLITLEDILEEIVGEIYDEYDRLEPRLVTQEDGSVVVDARLDVEELMEHFDRPRPEGKFESVGGLLIHFLGRVPQVNDTVVINDLELTVKSADERRAKEVLVRPIESQKSPAKQV